MRVQPPNRRRQIVHHIEFANTAWRVGYGFHGARVNEIFIEPDIRRSDAPTKGAPGGTFMTSVCSEVGMLLSRELQSGAKVWQLMRFFGWRSQRERARQRDPDWPASLALIVLLRAAEAQKAETTAWRAVRAMHSQTGD